MEIINTAELDPFAFYFGEEQARYIVTTVNPEKLLEMAQKAGVVANIIGKTTSNGELGVEYAELNQGRLPYYHRLDFSLSKSIKINKNSNLDITASVTNAYNRENIFYFNLNLVRSCYERYVPAHL